MPDLRSADERFDAQVIKHDGGCWEWTGSRSGSAPHAGPYIQFRVNGQRVYIHRYAYERFVGPIPEGFQIDHLCRNTRCVNPAHLEAVTPRINVQRQHPAAICRNGHPYEPGSYFISNGSRRCRTCFLAAMERFVDKKCAV